MTVIVAPHRSAQDRRGGGWILCTASWPATTICITYEKLIPGRTRQNRRAIRYWADAFFYRPCAIPRSNEMMAFNEGRRVPPAVISPSSPTTFRGVIDYVAARANKFVTAKIVIWVA